MTAGTEARVAANFERGMVPVVLGLLLMLGLVSPARATFVLDLTTKGSSGTINGAIFTQTDPQPTGTGFIDPFLRLQAKGTEQGYNTSYRPVQFDEKTMNGSLNYTHDLLLSDTGTVTKGGVVYRHFLLDINEANNDTDHLLSLDRLQLFLSNTASLHNYVFTNGGKSGSLQGATLIYDLDGGGGNTDNSVLLNYSLNSGSGSGDLFVDVPDSVFQGGSYLYLYSKFGELNKSGIVSTSDAGFEEWTSLGKTTGNTAVPEPASILLLGTILAITARTIRKARHSTVA